MLDQIIKLLENETNILIATVDKEKKPNVSFVDCLIKVDNNLYFIVKKGDSLLKNLKNNNSIAMYLASDDNKLRLKGTIKILEKNKKKDFIESNSIDKSFKIEIIKIKNIVVYNETQPDFPEDTVVKTKYESADSKYRINSKCKACNKCYKACPYNAISKGKKQYKINPEVCVNCGLCYKACPHKAINKPNNI